jgi:D-alanyl-D-alanine carboxypeptidase
LLHGVVGGGDKLFNPLSAQEPELGEKMKTLRGKESTGSLAAVAWAVVLCLFFFPLLALLAAPQAEAKYASLIMDAETGRILYQTNANTRNYPASLTKMMTLYLVFSALDNGRLKANDRLPVSARAARQPSSKLGLRRGETISVHDAILAIITKSANDAATVLAEALGGSERRFAMMMTAKARQLGMSRTTFRNASGLYNRGHMSTARDMAVLARRLLIDFPNYYRMFSTAQFSFDGRVNKNHNKLLKTYRGADGIKTGYIHASGYNLVASARRGGRRLIGVVFGGRTARSRNRQMTRLLDKGFRLINAPQAVKSYKPAGRKSASGKKGKVNNWGIQVGAYKQYRPAYEIARRAVGRAPAFLARGTIKVVPLRKGKRAPIYRGRILGISKRQAYRACKILEKRNFGCMELRIGNGVQLASTGG